MDMWYVVSRVNLLLSSKLPILTTYPFHYFHIGIGIITVLVFFVWFVFIHYLCILVFHCSTLHHYNELSNFQASRNFSCTQK